MAGGDAMMATLSEFGTNSGAIWMFASGVLVVLFVCVLVCMAVAFTKRLLDSAGGSR